MKAFIKEVLSENGSASSKRVAFFILLFAFLAQLAVDLVWGKLLSDTLRDQLYYAMLTTLGAVVGVTVFNGFKDMKIAQSSNNGGAANPPQQ